MGNRFCLVVFLLGASLLSFEVSAATEKKTSTVTSGLNECEDILAQFEALQSTGEYSFGEHQVGQVNSDLAVLSEEHKLTELFAKDDAKNLAVQRPLMAMNSAQSLLTLIYSQGSKRIHLPGSPHARINYYPIFSDGLAASNGVQVVAQYTAVSEFVDSVEAQAVGDRSGNSPTLLEGPHGTGKSEFLKIIRALYINLTSQPNSEFATYTFEFKDLHLIPSLRSALTILKDANGNEYTMPKKAPNNHSPIALLPEALQREVFRRVAPRIAELTHGLTPIATMELDPQSKFYADQILLHYKSQLKNHELTNEETLAILSKHVVIRRVVFGRSPGTLPTIEFQGNDLDQRGLFIAPDPMIAFTSGLGGSHPLAFDLTGKVLMANRNALLLDEVLRNKEEFQNFMLGVMESRAVDLGRSPRVSFDAVLVAATNEANTNAAKKDPKLDAMLDRFNKVLVPWPVRPTEVAETMLYMKQVGLVARPLSELNNESENSKDLEAANSGGQVSLRELFPLPELGQPVQTPDGRYRIWYKKGNTLIDVSPHALMFLSEVVAATRVKTNISGYEEVLGSFKVVNDPIFRSEIKRVLLHEGRERITSALSQELEEVVTKLREGNSGISSRDAGRWLTLVLAAAATPENHNTVTLDLVMRVFKRAMDKGTIRAPSLADEAKWNSLARRVAKDIVLPRLKGDIQSALASDSTNLDSAYDEVIEELKAEYEDPEAKQISRPGVAPKSIDTERMNFVKANFLKATGRPLSAGKILTAVHNADQTTGKLPKHEQLWDIIRDYYAEIETKRVSIDNLYLAATTGTGNDEVKAATRQLIQGMERLGYSEFAAIQALETAKHWKDELEPKP